jgi:uncharacterized protein YcbX
MADAVGTVAGMWRYPVKSMQGERLDAAAAGEAGLAGDRRWAVVDTETGKVVSAKRPKLWLTMLECSASYVEEPEPDAEPPPVRIGLPDGDEVRSDDADCDRRLSEALGRTVTLRNSAPEGTTYELRALDRDGLEASDPEQVTESPVSMFAPPNTFFDTTTLHLVTTATLKAFAAAHPDGEWDPRRFRPNLLVEADGADGLVENEWVGRALSLGDEAQASVLSPMPRCVMTTLPQRDLPRDSGILRTLAAQNRTEIPGYGVYACAGVMANFSAPGRIAVGDAVSLGEPLAS